MTYMGVYTYKRLTFKGLRSYAQLIDNNPLGLAEGFTDYCE